MGIGDIFCKFVGPDWEIPSYYLGFKIAGSIDFFLFPFYAWMGDWDFVVCEKKLVIYIFLFVIYANQTRNINIYKYCWTYLEHP